MKPLVMAILLLAVGSALPQTTMLDDASQRGSPVVLSGTATAADEGSGVTPYSIRIKVSATNISSKGILLMVVTTDVKGMSKINLHNTRKDDYFFSEAFETNATVELEESAGPFGEPQAEVEGHLAQPRAVASVKFVQFADGSIWGDPAAGQEVLRDRRLTWDELSSLADTYRIKGQQEFVEDLKKPSQLNLIEYLQQLYDSNGHDVTGIIKKVTSMIDYADRHQRAMQSQGTSGGTTGAKGT